MLMLMPMIIIGLAQSSAKVATGQGRRESFSTS